jgi:magnesium chelatase family protein
MRTAMNQMQRSARAYHRVLKPGQTIVDLIGEGDITPAPLTEALQYWPSMDAM